MYMKRKKINNKRERMEKIKEKKWSDTELKIQRIKEGCDKKGNRITRKKVGNMKKR